MTPQRQRFSVLTMQAFQAWSRPSGSRSCRTAQTLTFFNYAGIFRPVYLYTTPRQFIKDITLVPDLEGNVEYEIETEGQGDVEVQVLDREGNVAARSQGSKGTMTIREPRLWEPWPGTPYLYTARVTLTGEDGADMYEQPFGLRTAEVKGKQFLLNGKPFYFKGFGKHEDSFFGGGDWTSV